MPKQTKRSRKGDATNLQQRSALRMIENRGRLEVRNAEGESGRAELILDGPVWSSEMAFEGEISPANVRKALEETGDVERLEVFLSSPGGDPFAAHTIHAMLRRLDAEVVIHLDGLVASAATIIAAAGDRVVAAPNSTFMIHSAAALMIGFFNAQDLRETADTLDQIDTSIVAAYVMKTGRDEAELKAMMDAETWMVGQAIVDEGFGDEMDEDLEVAASIEGDTLRIGEREFDLSPYRNRPSLGDSPDTDSDPAPVHTSGLKEVTATQFRDALADALGLKVVDEPEPEPVAADPPPDDGTNKHATPEAPPKRGFLNARKRELELLRLR